MTLADYPVVVLCGGSGTRLREQTELTPKPMIPIGPYPMVVHIMKWYAKFGFRKFILALGYKQEIFKQYFANYNIINNDIQVNTKYGEISRPTCCVDDWDVTLVDTGLDTLKGGRLKRVEKYIDSDTFMLTYGDGIGDVDFDKLLEFREGEIVTVTGVHPTPKFGEIYHEDGWVKSFSEKPVNGNYLVNGGFMVMDKRIFKYLPPGCDLEVGPLEGLAKVNEMRVYHHKGYWQNMDTMNDVMVLEKIWKEGKAPWKI